MAERPEEVTVSTSSISQRRLFKEPLEPIGVPEARENRELDQALARFARRTSRDDVSPLTGFLAAQPRSVWRASLLTELGEEY